MRKIILTLLSITLVFNLAFSFFNQEKLSEKKFFSNQTLVQESADDYLDNDNHDEFKYLSHYSLNNKIKLQKISKIIQHHRLLYNFTLSTPTPPPNFIV